MNTIKIYKPEDIEYQRLVDFCEELNVKTKEENLPATFYVKNVYFDFGQNWMWTTICCNYLNPIFEDDSSYQILNPKQHEIITMNYVTDLEEVFNDCFETMKKFVSKEKE